MPILLAGVSHLTDHYGSSRIDRPQSYDLNPSVNSDIEFKTAIHNLQVAKRDKPTHTTVRLYTFRGDETLRMDGITSVGLWYGFGLKHSNTTQQVPYA